MKIVVTGSKGFIGRNLCVFLREQKYDVLEIHRETQQQDILSYLSQADFVFHLAGINRPKNPTEFQSGNVQLTQFIVEQLAESKRAIPIVLTSSTQAEYINDYGISKHSAEKIVESYSISTGAAFYIYRLPNVFGKWCKPNYNSFVATFCYNILNNIGINVNDSNAEVTLVYIDDVCKSLISLLDSEPSYGFKMVEPEYQTTVGYVADTLQKFKESRNTLVTENIGVGFQRALYSTYLSYMQPSQFNYSIPSYVDERGVFCEVLKTKQAGQFSFFTAHPGITRGGHYHHTKNEKFMVIKGKALFKFENIISAECYEIKVNSENTQIVETVPGWSHDITNIGDNELVVMLWANEIFDRNTPDTITKILK